MAIIQAAVSQSRPSPAEPVSALRRIPIRECGEPLVDFRDVCPRLILAEAVFEYRRATLVRESVAAGLNRAIDVLPNGVHLGIIEGWRPGYIQRRMWLTSWLRFQKLHPDWSEVQLKRITNRYVAPPDAQVPPPHSTGGAVDVMLVDAAGHRLDHHSPFRLFDPQTYMALPKGLSETAARNRAILREAMLAGGLTNYPSEWWHWSFGDQGWAYRGSQGETPPKGAPQSRSEAFYGRIESPEGWQPDPADEGDEPLVRLVGGEPASGFPRVKD